MSGDGVSTKDTRKGKRKNPADSAGTDGAIEGRSPPENCTNMVSPATLAAKQSKHKRIAATKQATTILIVATPSSTVPTSA